MKLHRISKNQKENQITNVTSTRVNNFWSKLGINTLHKTTFPFGTSLSLLILLGIFIYVMGLIFSLSLSLITGHHIKLSPARLQSWSFIALRAIPIILVLLIYSNRKHYLSWLIKLYQYRKNCKHFQMKFIPKYFDVNNYKRPKHWKVIKPITDWFKAFFNDIKNHLGLITLLFVIVTATSMIIKLIFVLMAGPNLSAPTTVTLTELAKKDWLLIPSIIFISPVFEELVFRVLVPNFLTGCFNIVKKSQFMFIKYWSASLLTALIFAQAHPASGANWGMSLSLVVYSLLLQIVYKKSKSITLPICLHMLSNILFVIVSIV